MNIILDVEISRKRKKRVEFYRYSGITDTLWRLYDNNIKYMFLASKPDAFSPEKMVSCRHRYCFGLFQEQTLQRRALIPSRQSITKCAAYC